MFDDILAWQATIGDGIDEGSPVPFHYVGLKDDVDFQQIPWGNGRFDTAILERRVENSARMAETVDSLENLFRNPDNGLPLLAAACAIYPKLAAESRCESCGRICWHRQ